MAIVGSATVTIRALTSKIEGDIKRGLRQALPGVAAEGEKFGEKFGDSFAKGLKSKVSGIDLSGSTRKLTKQGQDAGRSFGDSFEAGFKKRMGEMGIGDALTGMRQQGEQQGGLFGQSFAKGVRAEMRKLDLTGLGSGNQRAAGEDAGQKFGESFGVGFRNSLKDLDTHTLRARFRTDANELGRLFGGEFNRGFSAEMGKVNTDPLSRALGNAIDRGGKDGVSRINDRLKRINAGSAGRSTGQSWSKGFTEAIKDIGSSPLAELATTGQFAGNALLLAVGAAASLGVSLVAVAGAAGQAAGALIVIPGILGAIAQAGAVMALSFKGVGAAIAAGNAVKNFKADAGAINAAADGVESAMRSLRDAIQGVEKAERDAARSARDWKEKISEAVAHVKAVTKQTAQDVTRAEDAVTRAKEDSAQATADAARTAVRAAESVENAENRLERAERNAAEATKALTQARKDEEEQLQQLGFSLEDAVLAQDSAALSLERAQERLVETQELPADNRMRREAELAFKQAELNLRQAKDRTADLQVEATAAAAAGVEGSDRVLDAVQREADAKQDSIDAEADLATVREDAAAANKAADDAVVSSKENVTQAEDNLALAVKRAAAEIKNAEREVKIARRDAAEAAVDSADRVRDAYERMADAQDTLAEAQAKLTAAQSGGNTALDDYRQKLSDLSPEAATFVQTMVGLQGSFKTLREEAGKELFPKLGPAISNLVDGFFPVLGKVLQDTGGVIGDIATDFSRFFTSPFFTGAFEKIGDGNNKLLGRMGDAAVILADAFTRIMVAAQPLIDTFGVWLVDAAKSFDKFIKTAEKSGALQNFFDQAGVAVGIFGKLFGSLGGLFTDVLGAGAESGLELVESLTGTIDDLRESLKGADMGAFFADAADNTRSVMTLLGGVAKIFIGLADNKGIAETADLLTNELLPNIEAIVTAVTDQGGPALAKLVIKISEVIKTITETGGMNAFVDGLTGVVGAIQAVINVLADTGLLLPLLTFLGTFKAFKIAASFLGLGKQFDKIVGKVVSGFADIAVAQAKSLAQMLAKTKIAMAVMRGWQAAQAAIGRLISAGMGGPVLIAIGLVVLALVYAYNHFTWFKKAVDAGVKFVIKAFQDLGHWIMIAVHVVADIFIWLYDFLLGHSVIWDIVDGIVGAFHSIVDPIVNLIGKIVSTITDGFNAVLDFVTDHWKLILGIITGPIGAAVLLISTYWDEITGFFTDAWNWVKDFVAKHWKLILGLLTGPIGLVVVAISNNWDKITGFFTAAWTWISGTFKTIWAGVEAIITSPIDAVKTTFTNLFGPGGTMRTLFTNFISAVETIWKGLQIAVGTPVNFVIREVYNKGIRQFWNGIAGKVGLPELGEIKELVLPTRAARGGVIPGYRPGVDSVPAILSPGEGILRPEVVRALGKDTIYRWNKWAMGGRKPGQAPTDPFGNRHYFQGGVVAPPTSAKGGFDWPWDAFKKTLKGLDPRNITEGLSYVKDVVVGALADSLRTLILKPLTVATANFAANHPGIGDMAQVPGGFLIGMVSKLITFLEGKDKEGIKKEMASGGILGSSGLGKWQFPLPQGSYRYGYGYGDYAGHTGQDLPAPRGTKIVSVGPGKVVISKDIHGSNAYNNTPYDSYGRYVKIEHAGDIFSLYGHMLRRLAFLGQIVAKGQIIGEVDSTGKSSGDHLHFEIRPHDVPSPAVEAFLRGADATGASSQEHVAQASGGPTLSAAAVARIAARRYGWTGNEWDALQELINAGGGATLWAARTGRVSGGIEAGLEGIKRRYGTPSRALMAILGRTGAKFHSGGWVRGTGEMPALVQSGEYVFSRAQAARLRRGAMVMPKANGDLQIVAEVAGGNAVAPRTTPEQVALLNRIAQALEDGHGTQHFVVNPSPGMDERELADKVGRKVAWNLVPR